MYIITLAAQEPGQKYDTLKFREFLRTKSAKEVIKWITAFAGSVEDLGLKPEYLKLMAWNVGPKNQDRTFICNGPSLELEDLKLEGNYGLRLRLLIE